jgi:copper chaperone CopZ
MKGLLFLTVFLFLCGIAEARFTSVVLGIDGLTCSACSYGTERSIRKLDFVEDVKMELNKNTAEITFKKEKSISIDALVKKVYDAGFSVRSVDVVYHFDQPVSISNHILQLDSSVVYVLQSGTSSLSGDVNMKFIKEKYVPKKELLKWKVQIEKAKEELKLYSPPFYFVVIP